MKAHTTIAREYRTYFLSQTMKRLAQAAHGQLYCGQTSSATFPEVMHILEQANIKPPAFLLDAGCGNGCFAHLLSQEGFRVEGIDLSDSLIQKASESRDESTRFEVGDFSDPSTPRGPFDAILCIGGLYWGLALGPLLSTWKTWLKIGGSVILFANLRVDDLEFEDQQNIDQTQFIKLGDLENELTNQCFDVKVYDRTDLYEEWLKRWCMELRQQKSKLAEELGEESATKMERRFSTYLKLATRRQVLRTVLEASLHG